VTGTRRLKLLLLCLGIGIVAVLGPAGGSSAAAAEPLWTKCTTGSGAGQCINPRGIAVDPSAGAVYVVDQTNSRINKLNAWGEFLMAWGWGVSDGSAELQTCGPQAAPPTATCQAGVRGAGSGQMGSPKGIAIDSAGDVLVQETSICTSCGDESKDTNRVQKFSPQGEFILMFGGEVNLTKVAEREEQEANAEPVTVTPQEENLCTAVSGDVCGGGTRGEDPGQFGRPVPLQDPTASAIAVGPDDTVYVGGHERIQKFNADGIFDGTVPDPSGVLTGEGVQSLTADSAGNVYLTLFEGGSSGVEPKKDVVKLSPSGTPLCTAKVETPRALATDAEGSLYVVDRKRLETAGVREFGANCLESQDSFIANVAEESTGIAAGSGCGIDGVDLYVGNLSPNSFVRAYGPPPDPELCPPPEVPPTISSQYATSVGTDSATLGAEINPRFWPDTAYYVEYGTDKCSEGACQAQPLPPGVEMDAVRDAAIPTKGIVVHGLQPGTTYHYRFVAASSGGGPVRGLDGEVGKDGAEGSFRTFAPSLPKAACPNQAFRTEASSMLPDCRAYEMVSLVDKNGGDVGTAFFTGHVAAAADGQRLTYSALTAFADPEAAPLQSQYLSSRGSGGWASESISPPRRLPALYAPGGASQFKAFGEDLCQAWFVQDSDLALVPGAPAGVPNLYRRDNCAEPPAYDLLSTVPPPGGFEGEGESDYYVDLMGVSDDGSHAVFRADAPLTGNACKTERIFQVYLTSPEAPLRLVSSLPGNKANCTHSSAGLATTPTYDFNRSSVYHAVSEDGSRIFWSAGAGANPIEEGEVGDVTNPRLYVRLNATQAQSNLSGGKCTEPEKACTLAISEAPDSKFVVADPAGETALYRVDDELFEFDVEANESHLIAKGVPGVLGASEDLTRIYLVSTEVLSDDQANGFGDEAQAGQSNLYLYDKGAEAFTFVAGLHSLEAGDGEGGGGVLRQPPSLPAAWEPKRRSSRLTPDGMHLAFTSLEPLTGYDNTDAVSGQPAAEVYLYDAGTGGGIGSLACISCNPSGARPAGAKVGDDSNEAVDWAAALLPGWASQFRPSRLLAADGGHLFFESLDSLVSRDNNGRRDVYEWRRAADEAECAAKGADSFVESAGGCLSLISSGRSAEESMLLEASADGRDVFFTTGASLLDQDTGLVDVYDAREGGGFPPPASPPAACEGEACQGPLEAPNDPTPASSTFSGAGNVVQVPRPRPRCAKGRALRKGRCVAKKKRKRAGQAGRRRR